MSKGNRKRSQRIWVTAEEKELFDSIKQSGLDSDNLSSLQAECKSKGIDMSTVAQVWHKSENFSIKTKHNQGSQTSYEDVRKETVKEMNKYSPKYPKIKRRFQNDPHLLVIDCSDIHINKLALLEETGEIYNSDIAVKRTLKGVRGLLEKSNGFEIEKILFVVGNDILNTDGSTRVTTKGTPQDTDLAWWQAFRVARQLYVKCIEMCMQVADVDVLHCPSNHDEAVGFFLADTLASWFRKSKNVDFFIGPSYRKYYQYHSNMLGLSHGDKGKMSDLPIVMAQEDPQMWAETKFRYQYLHHVHHSDKRQFQSGKDYIGVNVTYLKSPSSADLWHKNSGYISTVAVEAFLHSRDKGRVAHLTHYYTE